MINSYGLDFDTPWDMAHDPQMRSEETGDGICVCCGGVYPIEELERNGGLCPPCFYASLEPDLKDGEDETEGGGGNAG